MKTNETFSQLVLTAIARIKRHIDDHPLDRRSIDELLAMAGMNRSLLQKAFKIIYGDNIKEYRFKKRIEASCELLREGRLNIKQVAQKCGYDDPNSFSTAFRKVFQIAPTIWQRQPGNNGHT